MSEPETWEFRVALPEVTTKVVSAYVQCGHTIVAVATSANGWSVSCRNRLVSTHDDYETAHRMARLQVRERERIRLLTDEVEQIVTDTEDGAS